MFIDFITQEFESYLKENSLTLKLIDSKLYIISGKKFSIKIYDQAGHGFGLSANLSKLSGGKYYAEDEIAFSYVLKYLKINESFTFAKRSKKEYIENVPRFIEILPKVISGLNSLGPSWWEQIHHYAMQCYLFTNQ